MDIYTKWQRIIYDTYILSPVDDVLVVASYTYRAAKRHGFSSSPKGFKYVHNQFTWNLKVFIITLAGWQPLLLCRPNISYSKYY